MWPLITQLRLLFANHDGNINWWLCQSSIIFRICSESVGGVGSALILASRLISVYPIVGIDINDSKLQKAMHLGATNTINSKKEEIDMTIKELLRRLETIKDSLSDCDGMERWGIEGTMDDIAVLINDVDSFGVEDDYPPADIKGEK